MALHRLIDMEIGVPRPAELEECYREIGLVGGDGAWGGSEQPDQLRIVEAPYRQLRRIKLGCHDEQDIADTAARLDELGVDCEQVAGQLRMTDPINGWDLIVEPIEVRDIAERPERVRNRPGNRKRTDVRAELITESEPRPPRRLGHVVFGTPDPVGSVPIYKALGYRVSDIIGGGMGTFMRCSPDHHNLLIAPGPVPYLNHYAMEHDDLDSVARAATLYLRKHGDDHHVAGPGRHMIGGNEFWYMKDAAGNFFEFFSDMDRIQDDDGWEIRDDWNLDDSWSMWGPKDPPEVFFNPDDMAEIAAGWEKRNGN